jgi:hypothetical protein
VLLAVALVRYPHQFAWQSGSGIVYLFSGHDGVDRRGGLGSGIAAQPAVRTCAVQSA